MDKDCYRMNIDALSTDEVREIIAGYQHEIDFWRVVLAEKEDDDPETETEDY